MNSRGLSIGLAYLTATVLVCVAPGPAGAADQSDTELRFSAPLLTPSPLPDRRARIDLASEDIPEEEGKATESLLRFGAEYAFGRVFSLQLDVPFVGLDSPGVPSQSAVGDVELTFKFATFALAEHGALFAYGVTFGLPTGDPAKGIGNASIVEFKPFLGAGYARGRFETIAFSAVEIPANQNDNEEGDSEVGYNLSMLYAVAPKFMTLVEIDGETVLRGAEQGNTVINLSPGFKVRPLANKGLNIGMGASAPISGRQSFDVRFFGSLFYHF